MTEKTLKPYQTKRNPPKPYPYQKKLYPKYCFLTENPKIPLSFPAFYIIKGGKEGSRD